jgi:signal transduction histidine kinase
MKPEHLARAFDRFFRADPSGATPGTGLGLPLVREIVAIHGGRIELRSELGVGTEAIVWLPVSVDAIDAPDPEEAIPEARSR